MVTEYSLEITKNNINKKTIFLKIMQRKKHNIIVTSYILMLLIFSSCGAGLEVKKTDFKNIDNSFSGIYQNNSEKPSNNQSQLLSLFKLPQSNIDSIFISFTENDALQLTFKNGLVNTTEKFIGKFKKKGYYEFFFNKRDIRIPPIIPLIFIDIDIDRIRLFLTKDNDLIIEQYWEHSGGVFIFGTSNSGTIKHVFKKI